MFITSVIYLPQFIHFPIPTLILGNFVFFMTFSQCDTNKETNKLSKTNQETNK